MYGESVVIIAVPAFMMMKGTFASVTTGAMAAAFGVHTTPVMSCTFSRTMSSVARRFAVSGLMPVSSRLMNSSFTPLGSFDSFSFMYRSIAFWIWSPLDASGPEYVLIRPILTVWAAAVMTHRVVMKNRKILVAARMNFLLQRSTRRA